MGILLGVSFFLNVLLVLGYYRRRRRDLRIEAALTAYADRENWIKSGRGNGQIVDNVWIGSLDGATLARKALGEISWPPCRRCGNRDTRLMPGDRWDPSKWVCAMCRETRPIE